MKMDEKDKEKLERIEQRIRNSPKTIQTANGLTLLAALLTFIHRVYFAYSHEIAIWKGLVAGLLLAIIIFQAGMMLYQKKAWVYWAVLLVSLLVALFTTIHGLAEVLKFALGKFEDYAGFIFTALFWLISVGIIASLVRKKSRDYFRAKNEPDVESSLS